jgi:hypothetical protein
MLKAHQTFSGRAQLDDNSFTLYGDGDLRDTMSMAVGVTLLGTAHSERRAQHQGNYQA